MLKILVSVLLAVLPLTTIAADKVARASMQITVIVLASCQVRSDSAKPQVVCPFGTPYQVLEPSGTGSAGQPTVIYF